MYAFILGLLAFSMEKRYIFHEAYEQNAALVRLNRFLAWQLLMLKERMILVVLNTIHAFVYRSLTISRLIVYLNIYK